MSKPFRLQTILDLAEREAGKSAARLGTLNGQVQQAETKLGLLLQYREDYVARFRSGMRADPHSAAWRNFHDFMDKLDVAITQQRTLVSQAHELMRKGQAEHRDHQRRVKAFDTLAERHAVNVAREAGRVEQRALDELSANTLRRRLQTG